MPLMGVETTTGAAAQAQLCPATFWYKETPKESENPTDDTCSW